MTFFTDLLYLNLNFMFDREKLQILFNVRCITVTNLSYLSNYSYYTTLISRWTFSHSRTKDVVNQIVWNFLIQANFFLIHFFKKPDNVNKKINISPFFGGHVIFMVVWGIQEENTLFCYDQLNIEFVDRVNKVIDYLNQFPMRTIEEYKNAEYETLEHYKILTLMNNRCINYRSNW